METFTEIRCPACVNLGWPSSRLLLKINGKIPPLAGVTVQIKCHRCKSTIEWHLGTPIFYPSIVGEHNKRSPKV
jgi:DNA-directed RNA polymerase subunit RPC12/RpoP